MNQNHLRVEDRPHKKHFQPDPTLCNGRSETCRGMDVLRLLESQNDHTSSKHRQIPGMGLILTLLRRLSMTAWMRCRAFLNVQRTRLRIRKERAQGSDAGDTRQYIYPHLPGVSLARELRSFYRRDFQGPHRATLQVYLPWFITDNFVTSQRLEAALQVHALDVTSHLPHSLFVRVLERFQDPGPDHYGENGEEAGAMYCVFMTVTHWDPA